MPVIYLGSYHDGTTALTQHFTKRIAQLFGEQRSIRLNKSKISDIVYDASGIRVEKHDTHFSI